MLSKKGKIIVNKKKNLTEHVGFIFMQVTMLVVKIVKFWLNIHKNFGTITTFRFCCGRIIEKKRKYEFLITLCLLKL